MRGAARLLWTCCSDFGCASPCEPRALSVTSIGTPCLPTTVCHEPGRRCFELGRPACGDTAGLVAKTLCLYSVRARLAGELGSSSA